MLNIILRLENVNAQPKCSGIRKVIIAFLLTLNAKKRTQTQVGVSFTRDVFVEVDMSLIAMEQDVLRSVLNIQQEQMIICVPAGQAIDLMKTEFLVFQVKSTVTKILLTPIGMALVVPVYQDTNQEERGKAKFYVFQTAISKFCFYRWIFYCSN